jgi:nucleoside phosphorylase
MSSGDTNRFNVVILSAIPAEYQAVRAHLNNIYEEVHPQGTVYERGLFSSAQHVWDVTIIEVGVGNSSTSVEAERAISHFRPSYILFVGVAGGLKDVRLGDVVAATKVYGYEHGKVEATGFKTRPDVGHTSYLMEQRARAEARKTDWMQRLLQPLPIPAPQVYIGPIAAGEKVLASTVSEIGRLLKENYGDALAVEMEGRGFLQAAHAYPHVETLIVRGISDLVNNKRKTDAQNFQERAAQHASCTGYIRYPF